ncbi:hypothetical protein ACERII_21130 [Evansella sp. AB-rgal1]|uniref:hypothetical protein n=1 Tax=Evansella sp. AB-rgal1 TaxID=3242696 RepID=UPI00359DAE5B
MKLLRIKSLIVVLSKTKFIETIEQNSLSILDNSSGNERNQKIADEINLMLLDELPQEDIDLVLYEKFGIIPLEQKAIEKKEKDDIGLMSVRSDVSISTPRVHYDPTVRNYFAVSSFRSLNNYFYENGPCCSYGNVGGENGFGLNFNKQIARISSSLSLYNQNGTSAGTLTSPDGASNFYGVVFKGQDRINWSNGQYNWHTGIITLQLIKSKVALIMLMLN